MTSLVYQYTPSHLSIMGNCMAAVDRCMFDPAEEVMTDLERLARDERYKAQLATLEGFILYNQLERPTDWGGSGERWEVYRTLPVFERLGLMTLERVQQASLKDTAIALDRMTLNGVKISDELQIETMRIMVAAKQAAPNAKVPEESRDRSRSLAVIRE